MAPTALASAGLATASELEEEEREQAEKERELQEEEEHENFSNPPEPALVGAISLTPTEELLQGTVNPKGPDTEYWFHYARSPLSSFPEGEGEVFEGEAFGDTSVILRGPEESLPTGFIPIGVSFHAGHREALSPNTTYYWGIEASQTRYWGGSHEYGVSGTSSEGVFTTMSPPPPPPPPGVGSVRLKIAYPESALVEGEVNADGQPTTYYFAYGTKPGELTRYSPAPPPGTPLGSTGLLGVGASLEPLTPNTRYYFELVAVNSSGEASPSPEVSFVTPIPKPTVTTEGAEPDETTAQLAGGVNMHGFEGSAQFEYWEAGSQSPRKSTYPLVIPGTKEAVKFTRVVTELKPDTEYDYRAKASNGGGPSEGAVKSFITGQSLIAEKAPLPAGTVASALPGVACASGSACVAVGYYNTENPNQPSQPLAEIWNGAQWTLSVPALPAEAKGAALQAIACSDPAECTAVGTFTNAHGGTEVLIERWNGSTWLVQQAAGTYGLFGVSCPSSTTCVAVGRSQAPGGWHTLGEIWNGSEWTVTSTPNGVFQGSELMAVSCGSESDCEAVGSGSPTGLIEHWNGTTWSLATPAATSEEVILAGVACTSATACTAVGRHNAGSAEYALAETWNGAEWTLQPVPKPASMSRTGFGGVACTAGPACTAVGSDTGAAGPFASVLNGGEWRTQPTDASSGEVNTLEDVSCPAQHTCVASGFYHPSALGNPVALLESEGPPAPTTGTASPVRATRALLAGAVAPNGSTTTYEFEIGATTEYGRVVPAGGSTLVSRSGAATVSQWVSGLAAASVYHYRLVATNDAGTAYGADHTFTTLEGWYPIRLEPPGPVRAERFLDAVDCVTEKSCVAVGGFTDTAGEKVPLAETFNGLEWKLSEPLVPAGATSSVLRAMSCSGATACTAVGSYKTTTTSSTPLVERWNGKAWSIQSTPAPPSGRRELYGVYCAGSSSCTAVGSVTAPGGVQTLAEHWNGAEWTIQGTPNQATQWDRVLSISCGTSTDCEAVGEGLTSGLIMHWNGTEWSLSTPAAATEFTRLNGVSCSSRTACTAVGEAGSPNHAVAERWNGSTWSGQSVAAPTGVLETRLLSVSCSGATACTATGVDPRGSGPLAEAWDGTAWTLAAADEFVGVTPSLNGVACVSSGDCAAVGQSNQPNGGAPEALIEQPIRSPYVVGESAASVGTEAASMRGTINPGGEQATYHFEFGTTTAYGTSVPLPDAIFSSLDETGHVTYALSGLLPGTTYHYRLVASNAAGTAVGKDEKFTTK